MKWEITDVEVTNSKVTLKLARRDSWGTVRERKQMTFRRHQFERALDKAYMPVPWKGVRG